MIELSNLIILQRFRPWLFYDSKERVFAQSIEGKADVIYGRLVRRDGETWVQYWLWYPQDWSPLPWRRGHEGDWEMVQYLTSRGDDGIVAAVYAQHDRGEWRRYDHVKTTDRRPHVYVARGRHASYFERGLHRYGIDLDLADGKRCVDPTVEVMPEIGWPLVREPWGSDKHSPRSPGLHPQWRLPGPWARRFR